MTRSHLIAVVVAVLMGGAVHGQLDPNGFTSLGTLSHPSGTLTINTDTLTITGGTTFTGVALNQIGGPQIAVFDFDSITIGSAATVTISGSRPLALLSRGNATIQTTLTVSTVSGNNIPALGAYAGGFASASTDGNNSTELTQNGGGPGGGGARVTGVAAFAGGGGYGGYGGTGGLTQGGPGGLVYGNLSQTLQGGGGGGAAVMAAFGGSGTAVAGIGGGALEVAAAGTLTVANVTADGRDATGSAAGNMATTFGWYQAGGGAGGGILLSGGTGLTLNGSLEAHGGDGQGTAGFGDAGGGGGGRIALTGLASYTIGSSPFSFNLNGGNVSGSGTPAFAGVITVDALSTTIPSGTSVTLNGGPLISVAGSTTQTTPTIEAYARRDLIVNSGATVTLGMNNALQHLDANGNNVTTLTANGTFNLAGFSQAVDSFGGSGLVILPAGSTLTVGVNGAFSTYTGQLSGPGSFVKAGAGTQIVGASPGFTGQSTVTGGLLAIGDQALPNSTVVLAGGGLGLGFDTNAVLGALAGIGNTNLGGINFSSLTVGGNNASTTYAGSFLGSAPGGLIKAGTGTWTLTGTNTQIGQFNVQAGTVLIGSAGALAPSNSVTVSAGATLDLNGYSYTVTPTNALTVQGNLRLGGAGVTVASGATATYNGAFVSNGFLRGSGTQTVTGGATLSGITTSNSAVISQTGAGTFTNFTNGGALMVAAGLSTGVTLNVFTNQGSGSITVGQDSQVNAADFQSYGLLTLNPGSFNGTSGGVTQITNTGGSNLFFNGGSRTFISTAAQAANINAGIDLHGNDAEVAGGLFVNNGYVIDSTGGGHRIVADFGAVVKGAGFYQTIPQTINGGTFQTGNSPGSGTTGAIVLGGPNDPNQGLSSYTWQINDAGPSGSFPAATGTAGPTANAAKQVSGWGLLTAVAGTAPVTTTGNFQWDATPADKLTIHLQTLLAPDDVDGNPSAGGGYGTTGDNTAGLMSDFDPTKSYTWKIFDYVGTYTGPMDTPTLDASTIFDTAGFLNMHPGRFDWVLNQAAKEMDLTYTPTAVPEPGTLALTATAFGLGWFVRRRRAL